MVSKPVFCLNDDNDEIEECDNVAEKFPLTPIGVLAPGSAHARPSAQTPIDMSGNFPAHVSAELP